MAWCWVLASAAQAQPEVLLEPARVVTEPTPPPPMPDRTSIAWNGSELLVLWRAPCCGDRLFGRRLDASGAAISPPFDFAVPAYFEVKAVHPFGDRWLVLGTPGTYVLAALVVDDEGNVERLPDVGSFSYPYALSTAALGGSVFITSVGEGCVTTTELRPSLSSRSYAVDVGCRTEGATPRSLVSEGRLFVAMGTAFYEIVPGSGVIARRPAGDDGVYALDEGAFVRVRMGGVSRDTVVVEGIGPTPVETVDVSSVPTIVGLWRTGTGWLLLYSLPASPAPAVSFVELDEAGMVLREEFLGWGAEPVRAADRTFLVTPEGSLAIAPDGEAVFRLSAASPLPSASRWLHSMATLDGAWLVLSEGNAQQVITYDRDGALTRRGPMSPSDGLTSLVAFPVGTGVVVVLERYGALRSGSTASVTRPPSYSADWATSGTLLDGVLFDGLPHVLIQRWGEPSALQRIDGAGRPTGAALPLVLPETAFAPRLVECAAASAVFFVEEATYLRGRALGSGAGGEIWSIGRGAPGFAVTSDPGTQAIAWVSDAGRLSLTLLDAQCRPRETRELLSVGGLFRVMVAMQGEVAAVAYVEVEGGPMRAIFSSPSGATSPREIAPGTRVTLTPGMTTSEGLTDAFVTPVPGSPEVHSFLFGWSDQEASDFQVRARARVARVTDLSAIDAGAIDAGVDGAAALDGSPAVLDAGTGDAGTGVAAAGCGCRAAGRGRASLAWVLLVLSLVLRVRRKGRR